MLAAFDPAAHEAGPGILLVSGDMHEGLALCWGAPGGKPVLKAGFASEHHGEPRISGAYAYCDERPAGSLNAHCRDGLANVQTSLPQGTDDTG